MDTISVTVTRGATVESVHRVHAVALEGESVACAAGNPELVTFMRSAAKPLQALPLARARPDLPARELAIACASHHALPEQLAAVRALLAAGSAAVEDLENGPGGDPPSPLRHNCSGKHAGMLALAHARGWPPSGYRLRDHPVQEAALAEVAAASGIPAGRIATGTDGCGVVAFALPLARMAQAFAALPDLEEGPRVVAAMRARPELIARPGALDTRVLEAPDGWFAKGGAEGILCAGAPGGLGIALKVEDGNSRALEPAFAAVLEAVGRRLPGIGPTVVRNSRDEAVGEVRVAPESLV